MRSSTPSSDVADGVDADGVGRVGADHRAGLGLAVALHDLQARAPGRTARPPAPAARRRSIAATSRPPKRARTLARTSRSSSGSSMRCQQRQRRAVERAAGRWPSRAGTARCCQAGWRATWVSTRARITSSTRGTTVMMVGRTVSMSAARCSTPRAIDDLGADAGQEELADGVLVAVRGGQVGQIDLVVQLQRPQQLERAAAVRQDGAVRQHHALRRAAGAGGVDQAGQRLAGDAGGLQRDVVRGSASAISPDQDSTRGSQVRTTGLRLRRAPSVHHHQQIEPAGVRRPRAAWPASGRRMTRSPPARRSRAGCARDRSTVLVV